MARFISDESIERVKKEVNILSIVRDYTTLEERGSEYWGCCPFHKEKTPSFHVQPDKNFCYCFSCHQGGDPIKFLMQVERISYPEAIEELARRAGIALIYENNGKFDSEKQDEKKKLIEELTALYGRVATTFSYLLTKEGRGRAALTYILGRGVTPDTIEKFKLGYAPSDPRWLYNFLRKKDFSEAFLAECGLFSKKYKEYSFFCDRLIFPIFNKLGEIVAFGGRKLNENPKSPKYLNSGDLPQYKKGETLYAYNFARAAIKENKKVIFCEGYMDCISYHQCGITYAVAPLGTALTGEQIKLVKGIVEYVYLSFDNDQAGINATRRAIYLLRGEGIAVKVIEISGGKDPAEVMATSGKEANKVLTNLVNNSIIDSEFLLKRLEIDYDLATPDAVNMACKDYFKYVAVLKAAILQESVLTKLAVLCHLTFDAVKKDFDTYIDTYGKSSYKPIVTQGREFDNSEYRTEYISEDWESNIDAEYRSSGINNKNIENKGGKVAERKIKRTVEVRAILVIFEALLRSKVGSEYKYIIEELDERDFTDKNAKLLFGVLKRYFTQEESGGKRVQLTLRDIIEELDDEALLNLVVSAIGSGEFKDNLEASMEDSIKILKVRALERQRKSLLDLIKSIKIVTPQDKEMFLQYSKKKAEIDKIIDGYNKNKKLDI